MATCETDSRMQPRPPVGMNMMTYRIPNNDQQMTKDLCASLPSWGVRRCGSYRPLGGMARGPRAQGHPPPRIREKYSVPEQPQALGLSAGLHGPLHPPYVPKPCSVVGMSALMFS